MTFQFNDPRRENIKEEEEEEFLDREMAEIIEFFPSKIRIEIFSRLPVDSIIQCKLVCKTWRTIIDELLINDPSFPDMHTRYQLLSSSSPSPANAAATPSFLVRKKSGSNDNDWSIVGSCNGLVCLVRNHEGCPSLDVYICNPVTREYTNLPPVTDQYVTLPIPQIKTGTSPAPWERCDAIVATGLGYHDSTKEYKFVRIAYDQEKLYLSMYKLGSGTWSIKECNITYPHPAWTTGAINKQEVAAGLLFNGALYWSICTPNSNGIIISFDLETNKFRRVPSPPRSSLYSEKTIWVCSGGFYMSRALRNHTEVVSEDVWEMNIEQQDYTWIKIEGSKPALKNKAVALEEKIVLSYDYVKFGSYYPRIRSHHHDLEMIPYMRTLASLSAVGESVNVLPRRGRKRKSGESEYACHDASDSSLVTSAKSEYVCQVNMYVMMFQTLLWSPRLRRRRY